jgi:hypothetical protein
MPQNKKLVGVTFVSLVLGVVILLLMSAAENGSDSNTKTHSVAVSGVIFSIILVVIQGLTLLAAWNDKL